MHPRQRYLTLAVVAFSLLGGMVLAHGLAWGLDSLGVVDLWLFDNRELPASSVVGFALAFGAAFAVWRSERGRDFATGIADELSRVNWPSREQTSHATGVVLVAVGVCAIYLGLLDGCWLWLTNLVMGTA
jgi:preprotein translocase SecE subunit